jgi:hypothetical protein
MFVSWLGSTGQAATVALGEAHWIDLEAKELTRFRDDRSSEVVGAQSNCASHLLAKVLDISWPVLCRHCREQSFTSSFKQQSRVIHRGASACSLHNSPFPRAKEGPSKQLSAYWNIWQATPVRFFIVCLSNTGLV